MFSYLSIEFPTLDIPPSRAAEFTHTHARYQHELADIYFVDWAVPYENISTGTPVEITMNGVGSTRTIHGYIHHITPDISPSKNYVKLTVIGASYLLKQQSQKVWVDCTADQVIADIATRNNFSYIAIPTERVYDQISQAGMSDWELMVRLAKQSGYSLKADNTTIIFQPITQEFTDFRQQAALYTMNGLDSKITGIYSFNPLIGDSIPYADIRKSTNAVSGVDRNSAVEHVNTNQTSIKNTRVQSTPPTFDSYETHTVAPTFQIAKFEADAVDEFNRYAYRGTAVVMGNPTLLPDSPVYLAGVGSTYSGFWTVLSTENYVKQNVFTTTIEIGTDSLGLAAKWTDNKDVMAPEQTIKRVITPGLRQVNIVPKTQLKRTGNAFRKSATSQTSTVKNIPKTQISSAPSYKWIGTSGNLKKPLIVDKKMPPVVLAMRMK
jgi:phage protein D